MNAQERIADVIEAHRFCYDFEIAMMGCTCGMWCDSGPGENRVRANYADHVAAAVLASLEHAVITSQGQLDALPFLSIVREVFRPSPGSGSDYGGVYERRASGWQCIAGAFKDAADNGAPKFPCRVLWDPSAVRLGAS